MKNNMQVISSLLRLEGGRADHPMTRGVLRAMQNRIQAMALLHETLYRSGNFGSVDLGGYLKKLIQELTRSLASKPDQIQLHLDLASAGIDMENAIPCGLLVNELVSNAFKHAFPNGRAGAVHVELRHADEEGLRLRVWDDGIGLPDDFENRRGRSLGLQLVSDLARQLQGRLEVGPGSTFTVTFCPRPEGAARLAEVDPKTSGPSAR